MNIFYKKSWLFLFTVILGSAAFAQQDWPKSITGNNGDLIKIYQPQVESYSGNTIKSRSAVSVIQSGKTDPVFGAFWWDANVNDNGQTVSVQSMQVTNIKFPDGVDDAATADVKNALESSIPQMNISLSKNDLQSSLQNTQDQTRLSGGFNNNPPKVIFTTKPSMLVLIDGQPKFQANETYGVDAVINSPYTIVKNNNDGRFYLYGGKQWYTASSATGPYSSVSSVPDNLIQIENAAKTNQNNSGNDNNTKNDAAVSSNSNTIPDIIVSTEPAELIQSDGEANFAPVENTTLLYVKNSGNDIFMDVNSQQYYVLLSGRWYKSSNLKGNWQYISADQLPADFARIPAGSPKDNVLASVAGTDEANEAVMNAAIPQTAKVDRRTATTTVTYDGDPQFESISGTRLQYAVNASATVLKMDGMYYAVDNGVWYQGNSASGPWQVSTTRPADVDRIPANYPVYNSKYVYVYDANQDYVYTGYTPGYLNAYVYGPTLVYGTGYYYRPWYRHRYFARPYTWGFGMNYTPWYGYGLGYGFGYDWFDLSFGYSSWWGGGFGLGFGFGGWGWWGPSYYRPAYYGFGGSYYHNYGYYGYNRGFAYRNSVRINYNYTNNIYNGRRSVTSYGNRSFANNGRYNGGNRSGAFSGGNRSSNGNFGNRSAGNSGFNNGRSNNFQNQNNTGNRFNNSQGNRTQAGNDAGNNGRRDFSQGQNNSNNTRNPGYSGGNNTGRNFSQGQQPARQYNPQRSADNVNRSYSRPQQSQSFDRPQRSSAPSSSFGGGGGGGNRSSGNGGGGGSRGGGGGGSRGGGGRGH